MAKLMWLVRDQVPEDSWYVVLHNIWLALVRTQQQRLRELSDAECREAVADAANTLRTKAKGLIYEYRSQNPRVQLVADELALVISAHETGRGGYKKVELGELERCLRYVIKQIDEAHKRGMSFLDLASRSVTGAYLVENKILSG